MTNQPQDPKSAALSEARYLLRRIDGRAENVIRGDVMEANCLNGHELAHKMAHAIQADARQVLALLEALGPDA